MVQCMDIKLLHKYIADLDSVCNNEAKENLINFIDKGLGINELINELINTYIRTKSARTIEILSFIKEPYDEVFFNLIEINLKESNKNVHNILMLLGQLTQKSIKWIPNFPMYKNLLEDIMEKYICDTEDDSLKSISLYFLSCLLPHCPKVDMSILQNCCKSFIICCEYLNYNLQNESVNIHYPLKKYFNVLYGMFPNFLLSYIKKAFKSGEIRNDVYINIIEKYFSSVKFNPILISADSGDEIKHLLNKEPHIIWCDINNFSVNDDMDLNNFGDNYLSMHNFINGDESIDLGSEAIFNDEEFQEPLNNISFVRNEVPNISNGKSFSGSIESDIIMDDPSNTSNESYKVEIVEECVGKEINVLEDEYISDRDENISNKGLTTNLPFRKWYSMTDIYQNKNKSNNIYKNIWNDKLSKKFQSKKDKYMKASKYYHECIMNLGQADCFPGVMYDDMGRLLKNLCEKDQLNVLRTRLVLVNQHLLFERYSRLMYLRRIKSLFKHLLDEKNKNKYFKCLELTNKELERKLDQSNQLYTDLETISQEDIERLEKENDIWQAKVRELKDENEELKIKLQSNMINRNFEYIGSRNKEDEEKNLYSIIRDFEAEIELLKGELTSNQTLKASLNEALEINSRLNDKFNELKIKYETLVKENYSKTTKSQIDSLESRLICKEDELIRMQQQLNNARKEYKIITQNYRQLEHTVSLEAHKNKEIKALMAKQAQANSKLIDALNERFKTVSVLNEKQTEYISTLLGVIEKNKKCVVLPSNIANHELWNLPEGSISSELEQLSQDNLREGNNIQDLSKNNSVGQKYLQTRNSGRNSWNNSESNRSLNINRIRYDSQAENSS